MRVSCKWDCKTATEGRFMVFLINSKVPAHKGKMINQVDYCQQSEFPNEIREV
jgi:hypothetical protein